MKKFKKSHWLTLTYTGLMTSIAALAGGCEPGFSTSYYDYLTASGTVLQADGVTPVPGLAIDNYDWIVSYTDGSTVAVPFTPAVSTDATGKFNFDSASLALKSGNLAERCTDVCVATSIGVEDYCADYTTEYGNEYCADWETGQGNEYCTNWETSPGNEYCSDWEYDSNGNEYCANWETKPGNEYCTNWEYEPGNEYCADWEQEETTYCSRWDTREYTYCSAWGQDCEYYYPSRDIGDITQAYSEITYTQGTTALTTQSSADSFPDLAVQQVSTTNDAAKKITVDTIWNQADTFVTPLVIATPATAKKTKSGILAPLTASQAKIVAKRNAAHVKARKITKAAPTDRPLKLGRNHKAALKLPFAKLTTAQKAKIELARIGCGAEPKSASSK